MLGVVREETGAGIVKRLGKLHGTWYVAQAVPPKLLPAFGLQNRIASRAETF